MFCYIASSIIFEIAKKNNYNNGSDKLLQIDSRYTQPIRHMLIKATIQIKVNGSASQHKKSG